MCTRKPAHERSQQLDLEWTETETPGCPLMSEWLHKLWCICKVQAHATAKSTRLLTAICNNLDEFSENKAQWEKPTPKGYTLYIISFIYRF